MILGINVRYTMWRSDANHTGIGFERYFTDPDAMLLRQLEHKAWVRRHVPQDSEMGLPTAGWDVQVDFQNSYEAGWFGCPVRFFDGEVPDTEPQPTGEADKRNLIERGLPDPFDLVLPSHRRLIDELSDGKAPNAIRLCGDATHHFGFLRDELDVQSFDTGFPVDFGQLRAGLGPDIEIKGGPSVMFLQGATPEQVRQEVRRILTTGVAEGRRLILREGNNLPPDVALETLWAFYDAVRDYGAYDELDLEGTAACC
jgi:hypothetical protein